jgi:hypothetical protein
MDKRELQEFTAKFWKIDLSKINNDLKLNDENLNNRSSIRFYQYIAAIESNFDVKIKDINKIITFEDLLKNIT